MKRFQNTNPFILFFPLLILYFIILIIYSPGEIIGDENRFLMYANNLTNGYYSPPPPAIDLGNGPGYPLLITPFIALNSPLLYIELLNGVLYYLSIVFLFKALQIFVDFKFSMILSLFWAFYPSFFEHMSEKLPEILAPFLIVLFSYLTIKAFKEKGSKKNLKFIIISGFTFGYLALTKPIFGYVIMVMLGASILLIIINSKNSDYKTSLKILTIALITTVPYLTYTYSLSGKLFYWSSFGGNNLYWMSSPYEGEFGDWMGYPPSPTDKHKIPGSDKTIILRHKKDFDRLLENEEVRKANVRPDETEYNLTKGIAQDDLLKSIAIENIKAHPLKFLENIISNGGRILFNYPSSYTLQNYTNLRRLPVSGTLTVISLFCMIITIVKWRHIHSPIRFLIIFCFIYLGGSLFGSAGARMFFIVVPVLLLWMAYILHKSVRIKLDWS